MSDRTHDGRAPKLPTVIDAFERESLDILTRRSIKSGKKPFHWKFSIAQIPESGIQEGETTTKKFRDLWQHLNA